MTITCDVFNAIAEPEEQASLSYLLLFHLAY